MKKLFSVLLAVMMLASLTLSVSAAESDFVPSIEMKPGPGIVPGVDEDGVPTYGEIIMPDGTVIPLPEGAIVITPIGGMEDASDDVKDALQDAYDALQNADSLSELIESLQSILDQYFEGAEADDIVVTDLFHVGVIGDYENYLNEGGKLKVTLSATDDIILALMEDSDLWSVLSADSFIDNGDGTYTVVFDAQGVFAFLKNAASVNVDPENPGQDSPTTGDNTQYYMIGAAVLFAVAGGLLVAAKKQKA